MSSNHPMMMMKWSHFGKWFSNETAKKNQNPNWKIWKSRTKNWMPCWWSMIITINDDYYHHHHPIYMAFNSLRWKNVTDFFFLSSSKFTFFLCVCVLEVFHIWMMKNFWNWIDLILNNLVIFLFWYLKFMNLVIMIKN